MDNSKTTTTKINHEESAHTKPAQMKMQVGNTTYDVSVYFNPDSRETITDKIIRMLRNEVRKNANF